MSPRKRSEKPRAQSGSDDSHDSQEVVDADATPAAPDAESTGADHDAPEREVSSVDAIAGVNESEASAEMPADEELLAAAEPVAAPSSREHLKRVVESLVFVSEQVISAQQIARIVKGKVAEIRELMPEVMREWEGRGVELVEVSNGYQFRSAAASAPFVRELVSARPVRLTRAQLETLALVAYRQPITRPEIDDVRGVDSGSALKVLLERGLLKILGRKDEAGRPLLYGSTPYFLEFFGMKSMSDLPTLKEFTDLTEEHRALFKAKLGEVPEDLGAEKVTVVSSGNDVEEETINDEELMAIAEAAKAEADDNGAPRHEPRERPVSEPEETAESAAAGEDSDAAS